MPIDEFVRDGKSTAGHPLLRFAQAKQKEGFHLLFHLEVPARLVGYVKAKIYLRLFKDGSEASPVIDDWDDGLNDSLILMGVRAESLENEKERFALALRASFRRPELRFGDGYLSAVLTDFVRSSDFHKHPAVAPVLEHIPRSNPRESQAYHDCKEMIEHGVRTRGGELHHHLEYEVEEAVDILAGALAKYLDERFSVSNRRLLGLL